MPSTSEIHAVVFDMGGVLVELGPLDEFLGSAMRADQFWPAWLASPTVRRFERGACSVEEFGIGLRDEFDLALDPAEVVERFRCFPRGLFTGAAELVRSVVDGVVTAVLSNTNQLHWEQQPDAPVIKGLFDHRFLSYEMGVVKPDTAIFEEALVTLECQPGEVLFIDDNQMNVDGARALGIDAHLAKGVDAARRVLTDRHLLADPTTGG